MSRTSTPGKPALGAPWQLRVNVRRAWLLAHRWLGLAAAAWLVVAGLTGSLLVIAEPVDESVNEDLLTVPAPGPLALAPALEVLRAGFPEGSTFVLRPPRAGTESLQAIVRGPWTGTVFLHPTTGAELGRRGEAEGFFHFLFVLHSSAFAGDAGKAAMTLAALAYVVMLVSGLVLWWPARWRAGFTVRASAGLSRGLFDLHRVGGAVFGMVVLVSVASGAYMAWPPIARWVSSVTGEAPRRAPAVLRSAAPAVSLDAAVARAQALFPAGRVGYVQVPASDGAPLRVRLRLPDDPHPNGLTSVWLHPRTGDVLDVHLWSDLDLGTRAYSYVYPLHTGELGGTPMRVAVFLTGLLLSGLGATGAWLWWRRRPGSARNGTPRIG